MMLDVISDREFQTYLDRMEQRLHVAIFPVLVAGIRLQLNRNSVQAEGYVQRRGKAVLLKQYGTVYRDQFRAIAAQERKAVAGSLSQFMTEQLAWMTVMAGTRITGISSDLSAFVARLVMDMVRQGKSTDRIIRALGRQAPELSRGKAAAIARTETHNAAMAAQEATIKFRRTPVKTKTWITAGDDRVRESHAAVHGVTLPFEEAFDVGGSQMMRPGDQSLGAGAEEIVNCRCALLYNSSGEGAARPAVPAEAPADLDARRAAAGQEAEAFVRGHGRATGNEALRWVDFGTGTLSADTMAGSASFVGFSDVLEAVLSDATRSIEAHHNHPNDSSFSSQDLAMMAKFPGLTRLFAHGAQGGRYLATDARPNLDRVHNVIRAPSVLEREPMLWMRDLGDKMANRVHSHAAMVALDRERFVNYESTLADDLAATIKARQGTFDKLVSDLAKRAGGMKNAKAARIGKAYNRDVPAFIDPPGIFSPVEEWTAYRESLRRSKLPGLGPFIREADRAIARLRRGDLIR